MYDCVCVWEGGGVEGRLGYASARLLSQTTVLLALRLFSRCLSALQGLKRATVKHSPLAAALNACIQASARYWVPRYQGLRLHTHVRRIQVGNFKKLKKNPGEGVHLPPSLRSLQGP